MHRDPCIKAMYFFVHTCSFFFLKLKRHLSIARLLVAVPNGGLFVHPKTVFLSPFS